MVVINLPVLPFVEMDGQVAILVMVGVETTTVAVNRA